MCRLSAITAKMSDHAEFLFDELMLLSAIDQKNGAGVSDGNHVEKSSKCYLDHGYQWLKNLDKNRPVWMGHVRYATPNTAIGTPAAAHPFFFKSGLIGSHNGFVTCTELDDSGINVDSWQAFNILNNLLIEKYHNPPKLTRKIIEDWLSYFVPETSEYTFMLFWNNVFYIVRGVRTMHCMGVDECVVFNTSLEVLTRLKNRLLYKKPELKCGSIVSIPPFTVVSIDRNCLINVFEISSPSLAVDTQIAYTASSQRQIVSSIA